MRVGVPVPDLISHRKIARRIGERTTLVRRWIDTGVWPRPHSEWGRLVFYRTADFEAYLATGRWPDAMLGSIRK